MSKLAGSWDVGASFRYRPKFTQRLAPPIGVGKYGHKRLTVDVGAKTAG
ncbi:hypothetical protein [Paenibacillus polymyxa]|nr:hypothetical protein [Paenibacillus polymyxa]WDM20358.1 hypothetical protein J4I02_14935 [Paenibacillus polymyxa]